MKEKLRRIQTLFCLTLAGLILYSCNAEGDAIEKDFHNQNLKVTEKKFSELINDTKFSNAYGKVTLQKQKAILSRTVMEEQYNFTIADKPVKITEKENITTYNILINRAVKDSTFFENLVIEYFNDGMIRANILKYIPNDITNYFNGPSFNGNIELFPIVYNISQTENSSRTTNLYCSNVCTTVCFETTGGTGQYSQPHFPSSACSGSGFYTECGKECYWDNGGGGGDTGTGTGGTGTGTSGGSGGGSTTTPPISPTPVSPFKTPKEIRTSFKAQLNTQQLAWWNNDANSASVNSIVFYLTTHQIYDIEEQTPIDIAKELIDFAIATGSDISFNSSVNATNAMSFNNVTDAQNYLNNPSPQTPPTSTTTEQVNERIISNKIEVNAIIDLDINIKQLKTSPFTVTEVTSDFSGITFGNTWNQQTYSASTANNVTTISVIGTRTIALFINGIGVISVKHKEYQIRINPTTGAVISFFEIL